MQVQSKQQRRDQGFTLVELMVVVVILGLLATLGAVSFRKFLNESRVGTASAKCKEYENAIELHTTAGREMPVGEEAWQVLIQEQVIKDKQPPKDPWNNVYQVSKEGDDFVVWSKGKDGTGDTDDDVFSSGERSKRSF